MSERTCIGCRGTAAPTHLLRLVRGADGRPRPDPTAATAGRGAWVHPRPGCVTQAARQGGLARAFRAETRSDPETLLAELRTAVAETRRWLTDRWERGGRAQGPLARRLAALETAARDLGTGTRT
jgi:predicted RNA-binding protein YlxR (DUF448 family)